MIKFRCAIVIGGIVLVGCGTDEWISPGQQDQDIIHGQPVNPEELRPLSGTVELFFIDPMDPANVSSGTGVMLTNDWLLTARHVVLDSTSGQLRDVDNTLAFVSMGGLPDSGGTFLNEQFSNIERIILPPLAARLDLALVKLTEPFQVLTPDGLDFESHRLPITDQKAASLLGQDVLCMGYGLQELETTDPLLSDRLRFGEFPIVATQQSLLQIAPSTTFEEALIDVNTHVYSQLNPGTNPTLPAGSNNTIPAAGDSGGPCFLGPQLVGIMTAADKKNGTVAAMTEAEWFRAWANSILFDLESADFEKDGTPDVVVSNSFSGANFALTLGLTENPADPEPDMPFPELVVEWVDADNNGPDSLPLFSLTPPNPFIDGNGVPWSTDLVGIGEFNGDHSPDLVFTFDRIGGPVERFIVVSMSNSAVAFESVFSLDNNPGWEVATIADVDADGRSDVVLRASVDPVSLWVIPIEPGEGGAEGTVIPGRPIFVPFPPDVGDPSDVDLVGAVDFNHLVRTTTDGTNSFVTDRTQADFFWLNRTDGTLFLTPTTGRLGEALTFGMAIGISGREIELDPEVIGLRDYNHDGYPDILWRHRATLELSSDLTVLTDVDVLPDLSIDVPVRLSSNATATLGLEWDFAGPR